MLRKQFKISLVVFLLLLSNVTQSHAATSCVKAGYTIGFFNGVWNTEFEAKLSLENIAKLQTGTLNNLPVTPHLFYNQSGCDTPGATCLQDLAETFIQRANELDSTGQLSKDFTLFWESVTGDHTYTDKLSGFVPGLISIFSSLYSTINAKVLELTSQLLSNPPTSVTMAQNNADLDQLAADGQYFMLIAHSQGNLFMNQAYDHIVPTVGASGVQATHIAPASPTLRGDYVLSSMDTVINGLALLGSMQPSNFALPLNPDDATGHTLLGTYLSSTITGSFRGASRTPVQVVTDLITAAMNKLGIPTDPVCAKCSSLPNPFTLAQYNQIVLGTTVAQANSILGCVGTLSSPAGLMPESYFWSRIAMTSQQMVIATFFNKLYDPAQGSVKEQSGLQ